MTFTARRGCYLPSGRYSKARVCRAPSASAYRNAFRGFDAKFPWVKTYSAWNEINHKSQPTFKSPRKAAGYWLWGLHNYGDVNRRRMRFTKAMLRTVPGEVWLTETGGVVQLLPSFKRSPARAAARTKGVFRLVHRFDARRHGMRSKITRLFVYAWFGEAPSARFDAGLVNPDGSSRPGLKQFRKSIKGLPR